MRWLFILVGLAAFAAEPLPPEVERRADLARLIPAPFSGSALLHVARMKGLSPAQRADLAGEAYRIATAAKLKDFGSFAGGDDSSAGALQTLSWMEDLNPLVTAVEAYQMDRKLPFPMRGEVPRAGCEVSMVEDPHGYYAEALQAGEDEFRQAFGAARKSIEVARAAAALRKASDSLREELLPALDAKLAGIEDSDREFHYAVHVAKLGETMLGLGLVETYRTYLARHWARKRCADLPEQPWEKAIADFNKVAAKPLAADAAQGREIAEGPTDEVLYGDAEGRNLAEAVDRLKGDESAVTSFLRRVDEWRPELKRGAVDAVVAKGLLYYLAWIALRDSPYGDRPVRLLGKQLAYGTLKKDAPVAWMLGASVLMDWAKNNEARIAELKSMGDPALAAYLEFGFN